jgi:hypothetical protein
MHPFQKIGVFVRDNRQQLGRFLPGLGFAFYAMMILSGFGRHREAYGVVFTALLPLLGLVVGVLLFTYGFVLFKEKRLIENIPRSKARSAAMGLVEVAGRAEPFALLKSPLTATDCVYYRFKVEKYVRSGKNSHWRVINQGSSTHFFYIYDETGRILVDPVEAELHLATDYKYTGTDIVASGSARQYDIPVIFGSGNMRYTEWYILPGDSVYAIGTAKKWKNASEDHKFKVAEKLREFKENKGKMKQFDLNGDGKIDCEEWELARQHAEQDLLKEELQRPQQAEDDVVITRDPGHNIMIISEKSEKEVVMHRGVGAVMSLLAGTGLILWMSYLLLKRFAL